MGTLPHTTIAHEAVGLYRPGAHGIGEPMPNGIQREHTPAVGAEVAAAVLIVVALLVRRKKKHSRSAAGSESVTHAAGQVRDAGGHALGKAANVARDLVSDATDLVSDRNLNETLDRLQSALDEARSAAATAVRKAPLHRH
jgi:hypothetical protein